MPTIRVASRRSLLAMRQTEWVIERLGALAPDVQFEVVPIVTTGDRILSAPLSQVGGKGLFVSEIEAALLRKEADLAVHSLKDVPAELAPGLVLAGYPAREDARDALVARDGRRLEVLPPGAVVGTSSLRRIAQLRALRPDLDIRPIRGNIDTRLRKLETEGLDAIVLAAAGLKRMGWVDRITEYLSPDMCLPAVGQGLLGVECREDDVRVRDLLKRLTDPQAEAAAHAERTLLAALGGGCQVPIGGYAEPLGDGRVRLRGLVATVDGRQVLRAQAEGSDPVALGRSVAEQLFAAGADRLLAACIEAT